MTIILLYIHSIRKKYLRKIKNWGNNLVVGFGNYSSKFFLLFIHSVRNSVILVRFEIILIIMLYFVLFSINQSAPILASKQLFLSKMLFLLPLPPSLEMNQVFQPWKDLGNGGFSLSTEQRASLLLLLKCHLYS